MNFRLATIIAGTALLAGCATLSSIETSSRPLNVFELRPLASVDATAHRGAGHLLVTTPTASGALDSDRIAIKPSAFEIKFLSDARWVEDAPSHFQRLLVESLANSGRFSLVTAKDYGPEPDTVALIDLEAFHAAIDESQSVSAVVRATVTLVRGRGDGLSAKRFAATSPAGSSGDRDIVEAFDSATQKILREMTDWIVAVIG